VPLELRKTMAQMLGDVIALLAMKHRRVPLQFLRTLRTLWDAGLPENLAELENFARRLLFLAHERMLAGGAQERPTPIAFRPENSQGPLESRWRQRNEKRSVTKMPNCFLQIS